MKTSLFLGLLFFISGMSAYSQDTTSLNLSNSLICNYFDDSKIKYPQILFLTEGNERAKQIISKILEPVGLLANFEVMEGSVPNALASHKDGKRYIVYNKAFMDRIYQKTKSDYSLIAVLAHEIAHHLLGHTFEINDIRARVELEADLWSGFILFKLGATLREAQQVIENEAPTFPVGAYPGKEERLRAIETGWVKADEQYKSEIAISKRRKNGKDNLWDLNENDSDDPIFEYEPSKYVDGRDTKPKDKYLFNSPLHNQENTYAVPKGLEDYNTLIDEIFSGSNYNYASSSSNVTIINGSSVVQSSHYGDSGFNVFEYYTQPVDISKYLKRNFPLEKFDELNLELPISVELIQGNYQNIEIKGPAEFFDLLNNKIINDRWDITFTKPGKYNLYGVVVRITLPNINTITISGSGTVLAKTQFIGIDNILFKVRGSGDIIFDVEANFVKSEISGSGDIYLSGSSIKQEIICRGSGAARTNDMLSKECSVIALGSGECYVNALEKLEIQIQGTADVYYKGNPKVYENIQGSGKLIKL